MSFSTKGSFFYRCDRFHFSPQTNRMRYHKTVFCLQLETKKAQAKNFFFNFRKFFTQIFKIWDFQMTGNESIWVSYERRRNFKTNGWKIKFQKLYFLTIFHRDKGVKSEICRTYKKNYLRLSVRQHLWDSNSCYRDYTHFRDSP